MCMHIQVKKKITNPIVHKKLYSWGDENYDKLGLKKEHDLRVLKLNRDYETDD